MQTHRRAVVLIVLIALALLATAAGGCSSSADLVLTGGKVLGSEGSGEPADTVAMKDGWIVAVGSKAELAGWIGEHTEVVELGGRPVYAGFVDAHLHLMTLAMSLRNVDLVGTTSWDAVVERVLARAENEPTERWIQGRGWDQNDWQHQAFPHHAALSARTPDHPVMLKRIDGHALLGNRRAMELAGIDATTPAPPGGDILHDDDGEPTGVFIDNAMDLVLRIIPPPDAEQMADAAAAAIGWLHTYGITSIHDAGVDHRQLAVFVGMARAGNFDLRSYLMVFPDAHDGDREAWLTPSDDLTGDGLLTKRAIKVSSDGALGSRGALLLEPYTDAPDTHGLALVSAESVYELSVEALRSGMQMCVHAIGDRANRDILDVYERALAAVPPSERGGPERPLFRIEHAQILAPSDIPRFAELDVIPSMQALHQTSDMPWAEERVGPVRIRGAYAWRSLLDTGVIIPGGSDAPVETPDVLAGFHAAVTRTNEDGQPEGGWYAAQVMSRAEALQSVTLWPAMAAHQDDVQGRIAPGYRADLVVLDRDILSVPPEDLTSVAVDLTIFDGRIVYRR